MKFLGFELDRKVDLVAIAILLGFGYNVGYDLLGNLRGARVTLHQPQQVLIKYADLGSAELFVRFAAVLTYTNGGQPGHNAIVIEERLAYTLRDQTFEQKGQHFIRTERVAPPEDSGDAARPAPSSAACEPAPDDADDATRDEPAPRPLKIIREGSAVAFLVKAGDAVTHETYFNPFHDYRADAPGDDSKHRHFLRKTTFEKLIASEAGDAPDIAFTFQPVLMGEVDDFAVRPAQCTFAIDDSMRSALCRNGWASARCREVFAGE